MSKRFWVILVIIAIFAAIASAAVSAPTRYGAGFKLYGKYIDLMGETGIQNGSINITNLTVVTITGGTGNISAGNASITKTVTATTLTASGTTTTAILSVTGNATVTTGLILPTCPGALLNNSVCFNVTTKNINGYYNGTWYQFNGTAV